MKKNTNHVVVTSRFVGNYAAANSQTGNATERPVFINSTEDKIDFWSNEALNGGTAVVLSERKAGEKIARADGSEITVLKDGYNFVGKIGDAAAVRGISATKAALAEMAAS